MLDTDTVAGEMNEVGLVVALMDLEETEFRANGVMVG